MQWRSLELILDRRTNRTERCLHLLQKAVQLGTEGRAEAEPSRVDLTPCQYCGMIYHEVYCVVYRIQYRPRPRFDAIVSW
jgi:hypothetical protein